MISTPLIIFFSFVLFVYWFRYSCLLILQTRSTEDYASRVAGANRLSFPTVQLQLKKEKEPMALDPLHQPLRNDYRIVCFLLRHAADLGVDPIEQRMLMLDYKI